jgi:hypothetical protein|tara:strand:- start:1039 stop:1443 length:405 start_codon:yes stop_codon:yes gene_type:complete
MKKNTYTFIFILLAILLFITIFLGFNFSSSRNTSPELPLIIEHLNPMPGDQVPQQTILEIDLPVGYQIELTIDDYKISSNEIEYVDAIGVYRWKPGPGKSYESWKPGKHTVKVKWNTLTGLPDVGEFTWNFSTY